MVLRLLELEPLLLELVPLLELEPLLFDLEPLLLPPLVSIIVVTLSLTTTFFVSLVNGKDMKVTLSVRGF